VYFLKLKWHVKMKTSFITILLGFALVISNSVQALEVEEDLSFDSISQFICKITVSAGSEDQSGEKKEEEEEEEPDCD
jgi:hypothetical protein